MALPEAISGCEAVTAVGVLLTPGAQRHSQQQGQAEQRDSKFRHHGHSEKYFCTLWNVRREVKWATSLANAIIPRRKALCLIRIVKKCCIADIKYIFAGNAYLPVPPDQKSR